MRAANYSSMNIFNEIQTKEINKVISGKRHTFAILLSGPKFR